MSGPTYPPLLRIRKTRRSLFSRIFLVAGALVCFVLGIVGWLLPVVTGIPFYVLGLVLLSMASSGISDWINRAESRLSPRYRKLIRDALARIPIRRVREM
jgi:uncharacterized membrane protein YbaN (DUF454 family)